MGHPAPHFGVFQEDCIKQPQERESATYVKAILALNVTKALNVTIHIQNGLYTIRFMFSVLSLGNFTCKVNRKFYHCNLNSTWTESLK